MTRIVGIGAPLLHDDIDTDVIIPSRAIRRPSRAGLGAALFADWRYLDGVGVEDPAFPLNQPAYRGASILLVGANFGCGSSREAAVWAMRDFGIRGVIARSFGEVFQANCVHNGVVPALMAGADLAVLAHELTRPPDAGAPATDRTLLLDVDRLHVVSPRGGVHEVRLAPSHRQLLLRGWTPRDLALSQMEAISAFRARDAESRPWLYEKERDDP